MLRYVGLDVHKVWTQVARHLPDGTVQRERIATNPGAGGSSAIAARHGHRGRRRNMLWSAGGSRSP